MNVVKILLAIFSSVQENRVSLMQHHGSVLPGYRGVAFKFLPLPVVGLKVETP
jgi:hypothetical protein